MATTPGNNLELYIEVECRTLNNKVRTGHSMDSSAQPSFNYHGGRTPYLEIDTRETDTDPFMCRGAVLSNSILMCVVSPTMSFQGL